MSEPIKLLFDVDGKNFISAGEASEQVKKTLKQLGLPSDIVRKVAIAMYEGEINMVIHAQGGKAEVNIYEDKIDIILTDVGKGIENVELAMKEGYSTAPDNVRSLGFGAGMGLPNMKKYTDYMHIDSEVNKGTKVFMTVLINDK